jgi:hypothetical protein
MMMMMLMVYVEDIDNVSVGNNVDGNIDVEDKYGVIHNN